MAFKSITYFGDSKILDCLMCFDKGARVQYVIYIYSFSDWGVRGDRDCISLHLSIPFVPIVRFVTAIPLSLTGLCNVLFRSWPGPATTSISQRQQNWLERIISFILGG